MDKIPIIVIVGPTASGKTDLAVRCAEEFNAEIISADSMQIYKGMSVATAKPTEEERRGIKHHLIDFLEPYETFSVADYVNMANAAADEILSCGKLPIVCGGTGLYVDSFVYNIKFTEEKTDTELRKSLEEKFDNVGAEEMLRQLAEFDKDSAQALSPNNKKRIIRAFEVYLQTGKTITQAKADSRSEPSRFNPIFIGINYRDRETLYKRINQRVDKMLEEGLLEEAKEYFSLPKKCTSSQAIGYKELSPYFNGEAELCEAVDSLKRSTRRYAKRQLTWFKRNSDINWFYPDDYESREEFQNAVIKYLKEVKI